MTQRRLAKWLILGISLVLMALFQNMSWVDIRDIAPRKPAGYLEDPNAAYVPRDLHARSLEEVGQGFLSHNFDPWFQQFETKYLRSETPFFGFSLMHVEDIQNGEIASVSTKENDERSTMGKWRVSMVTPQKMRVTLQKKWDGQDFEMTWEAQAGQEGIRWAFSKPLSQHMHLGFVHQTGLRQSHIEMNYSF